MPDTTCIWHEYVSRLVAREKYEQIYYQGWEGATKRTHFYFLSDLVAAIVHSWHPTAWRAKSCSRWRLALTGQQHLCSVRPTVSRHSLCKAAVTGSPVPAQSQQSLSGPC